MSQLDFRTLPEPGTKYKLGLKIGGGVGGEVFEAVENQTGKKAAIKMIDLKEETEEEIQREYHVLRRFSENDNFPEFYGIYSKKGRNDAQKIWLVMELCEGGEATALVRKLKQESKKMNELHIAYIIRETIKAVTILHENETSHRDIRGSNILLTADGRVKLVDCGISKRVEKNKKMRTCVGSPSWLAPEVITCQTENSAGYDKKADVWALGITAIELGDGQAPFEDMHPGRALFQIVNNPPPTLQKPSDWSQLYNDFISECLVKTPENRPHVQELLVHPFFEFLDKEKHFLEGLTSLLEKYKNTGLYKAPDVQVRNGLLKIEQRAHPEKILQEDLAAMTNVSEDSVLFELHERLKKNETHTFIGDILLILNANKFSNVYGIQHHKKYRFKAKSENAPHIYSIADSAYRDVFHHEKPQHVLFAGETGAGKTANMKHTMDHLLFLGQGLKTSEKIPKALAAIHVMGNATTPHNVDSTRHVLQMQLTFTDTGKTSGVVFRVYLLEKERITMTTKKQANFHLFYYFYDMLQSADKLAEFYLNEDDYKFLRKETYSSENHEQNAAEFYLFEKNLKDVGFEEEGIMALKKILAAVLLIGETEIVDDEDGNAVLETPEIVNKVADLLGVDQRKLSWALLKYCLIMHGEAVMRHNSKEEADEAKNVLARGLYSRLVDWVVNTVNEKISVSRVIYGDKHVISLLDMYGFECYKRNTLNQLFINTMNEQLQFHYNQQIFAWDKLNAEEDGIPFPNLEFNDNKMVIDLIMSKPVGLLCKIDEATRNDASSNFLDTLETKKGTPIFAETSQEFSINHYTGKLTYDASDMAEKNRDFLPPEIVDTMRLSKHDVIKQLFSSLLSKSGNLSVQLTKRGRNEGFVAPENENKLLQSVSTTPSGRYSQSRQMRTAATTFRAACLDLFKALTAKGSGFHFVRCLRTDLSEKPGAFNPEVIRQQLRALAVVNTVLITQQGYSYSVFHDEFIRRYKFLAFDFDENVEETKDNCRLLLLRLKLEGWTMGKTKVFLKYFNREYLTRLYETQIKKIVKVQSMMRAFMARRKLCAKIRRYQIDADAKKFVQEEEDKQEVRTKAAKIIQKRLREYVASKYNLTENEKDFIRPWCKRWRFKSIFQVLLLYRAERLQALVNFCLQIHVYNQTCLTDIQRTREKINFEDINFEAKTTEYLPPLKYPIPKLMFTWDCLNLRGNVTNCEPLPECNIEELDFQRYGYSREKKRETSAKDLTENSPKNFEDKEIQTFSSNDIQDEEEAIPQAYSATTDANKQNQPDTHESQSEKEYEILNSEQINTTTEDTKANPIDISNPPEGNTESEKNDKVRKSSFYTLQLSDKPLNNLKNNTTAVQKFVTSLNEMEEKFRNKNYNENGDDPPFNFRALLKKAPPIDFHAENRCTTMGNSGNRRTQLR